MLQPQSRVDAQIPSAQSKCHGKFRIFATLELFTFSTSQLEFMAHLNKLLPRRLAHTQASACKVLRGPLDMLQLAICEDRVWGVVFMEPGRRRYFAGRCSNTADGTNRRIQTHDLTRRAHPVLSHPIIVINKAEKRVFCFG